MSRHENESGLSLIEVLIAVLVSTVILLAMTMILINSWNTQEDVTSTTESTAKGQLIGSTIERAMRNAVHFEIIDGGSVLLVHTSLAGQLACQGFQLGEGQARMSISGAGPIAAHWTDWETAIEQSDLTPFFQATDQGIRYTFDVGTAAASVRFSGEVAARSAPSGESEPCWGT